MNSNYYAVIMAGGVGTRFWPMSRSQKPKQFIDILGTGETLIRQTFNRLHRLCPYENILVVTNKIYKEIVSQQLPEIPTSNILCEPCRRNTAPCICYAYKKILSQNANAQMIVAPSDHIILKEDKFIDVASFALESAAKNDCLITLGISPSRPDTGYGYIQIDKDEIHNLNEKIHKVQSFKEKPNAQKAQEFLDDGNYVWNSGIFIWSVKTIQNAFTKYLPDVEQLFENGRNIFNTDKETDYIDNIYPECQNISIDFGVMEKADNVYVYPSEFAWSDLGTWVSLFENSAKNEDSNVIGDKVLTIDTNNCIIKSPKNKLVVVQGLENYIVVDEGDVLLICNKDKEQTIKDIVATVEARFGDLKLI